MRRNVTLPLLLLLLGALCPANAHAGDAVQVVVVGPYLDLHTGPGRGYPVTLSVPRGARIELLFQRTDWVKVRTDRGQEGWAHRSQLEETLKPKAGEDRPRGGVDRFQEGAGTDGTACSDVGARDSLSSAS
jgi:uncharacterized protein YraI